MIAASAIAATATAGLLRSANLYTRSVIRPGSASNGSSGEVAFDIFREGRGALISLRWLPVERFERNGVQIAAQLPCQFIRRGIACLACFRLALRAGFFTSTVAMACSSSPIDAALLSR
jgi:hypothetical protein